MSRDDQRQTLARTLVAVLGAREEACVRERVGHCSFGCDARARATHRSSACGDIGPVRRRCSLCADGCRARLSLLTLTRGCRNRLRRACGRRKDSRSRLSHWRRRGSFCLGDSGRSRWRSLRKPSRHAAAAMVMLLDARRQNEGEQRCTCCWGTARSERYERKSRSICRIWAGLCCGRR